MEYLDLIINKLLPLERIMNFLNGICIVSGSVILICDFIYSQWLREENEIGNKIMTDPRREKIISIYQKIYSETSLTCAEAMIMAYKQIYGNNHYD